MGYTERAMERIPALERTAGGLLPGAEPFSLGPDGGTGVLLVHGFTSTPYDLRACGEYLADHGVASEGVLLAGHGTSPEDLVETRLADWLRTIRDGVDRLAGRCTHVFALGISLSGNLLLTVAPLTNFAGLILVGTPLRFRREWAYRAAYRSLRFLGREYQQKWYLEHLDAAIRERRPTYDRFPLRCAPDCLAAVRWSAANLPRIHCPVLILQSTTDHAVDERTVETFQRRLGTPDVTVRWFKNRYHVLLVDHGAEEVYETVRAFIAERSRVPARALRAPQRLPVPLAGSRA